jgi:hypothetical protein
MKCKKLDNTKFKKEEHHTGYNGRKVWAKLHNTCNEITCEHCRNECHLGIEGLHDIVNAKLGKPIHKPKSLTHLTNNAIKAQNSAGNKIKCSQCQN